LTSSIGADQRRGAASHSTMRTIDVDGAPLVLRLWGSEGGRPLFFWHALGPAASGATIGEVAPVLAERGFRVCAVDGPGFGASPVRAPDRYELEPLLGLVDAVFDEFGWERAVLVGHSWGGAIAVLAAGRRPETVDAVVLLHSGHIDYDTLPDVDPELPWEKWLDTARQRTAEWPSRDAFEQDLREALPRWSDALLDCFLPGTHKDGGRIVGSPPEARAAAMRGLARANVSDAWPAIAAARIPTLLLLASADPWRAQNEEYAPLFQAAVPQAHVEWLDATHAIPADVGTPLGERIADFVRATAAR
jgi:pimeloyl-ACP methyl ester carboxylesterase